MARRHQGPYASTIRVTYHREDALNDIEAERPCQAASQAVAMAMEDKSLQKK